MIHERIQGWKQKLSNLVTRRISLLRAGLAGRQGFEPRYADPESAVLPLDDLPAGGKPSPAAIGGSGSDASQTILQLAPYDCVVQAAEKTFAEMLRAVPRSRDTIPQPGESSCTSISPKPGFLHIERHAKDAAPAACAWDRDRSESRRSRDTPGWAFRSPARRRAAASPRTAGSFPASARGLQMLHHLRTEDAVELAVRAARRDTRTGPPLRRASPFARHCATDSSLRSMPRAVTPQFAHDFEKLTAAAADIEHVLDSRRR